MGTSSSLPAVKAQLVSLLSSALDPVPVFYGPPGPDGTDECVFLGRSVLPSEGVEGTQTAITLEQGAIGGTRARRIETYGVDLTFWTWRGDLSPADYQECEARAFELFAAVEDVLATNDKKLNLDSITKAQIGSYEALTRPHPSSSGLVSMIVATIDVQAVLT